jgi:hypothetical protein
LSGSSATRLLCRVRIYSFSEIPLIKEILYLKIDVNMMWAFKTKRCKAPKKWRNRARLIDLRSTKIEIIRTPEMITCENQESLRADGFKMKTVTPCVVEAAPAHEVGEDMNMVDYNLGYSELSSKMSEQVSLDPEESNVMDAPDCGENTEDFEHAEQKWEPVESSKYEMQNVGDSMESPEIHESLAGQMLNEGTMETSFEAVQLDVAEDCGSNEAVSVNVSERSLGSVVAVQGGCQCVKNLKDMEHHLESTELSPSVALCSVTADNSGSEEPNGSEATNAYEADDLAYELIATEKGPLNLRFLRALEKTSSKWCNDKQLAKIVKKMEKGKNLKRKEFDKVYMHIRTYCGYN